LALTARQAGRGLSAADGYIAAIASRWGYEVASRDVSPYRAVGLTVIDPWATPAETS
jgi:predicted nucleic acid-binding protein